MRPQTTVLLMLIPILLVQIVWPVNVCARDTLDDQCESLDDCVLRLRKLAKQPNKHSASSSLERDRLIKRLLSFEQVVPSMVELLADSDIDVANLAAETLRDARSIEAVYLPQIIAGLDRGLRWLPPALGHIDSETAAREAVKRYLVSEGAPHNQEAYAVKLCGARALPAIFAAIRCTHNCPASPDYYLLGYVLGEMDDFIVDGAKGLMEIADDEKLPEENVRSALLVMAYLGPRARFLEPHLLKLREKKFELLEQIDQTLIGIHANAAGNIFAYRLNAMPNSLTLRELAEIGAAGRDAGKVVLALLENVDQELRLSAARTLGFIDYQPAVPKLIELLNDQGDVRLNWVAAQALGRLHAVEAENALSIVASSHWYPPVQDAAKTAIQHIKEGAPYSSEFADRNFPFEFYDYEHLGRALKSCERPLSKPIKPSPTTKLYTRTAARQLKKLSYATTIYSYGPAEIPPTKKGEKPPVIEVTPDNMVEHREQRMQEPEVALRVADGWLAGASRGEWGGELVHIDTKGHAETLLNANVEDIYELEGRIIVLTDLAHRMSNKGDVYEASRSPNGSWSISLWRALPGAPFQSWQDEHGEVFIVVVSGGSLFLDRGGTMRMAPCSSEVD
jgi:HEAT repeat protein